jgi:hypothetical protein
MEMTDGGAVIDVGLDMLDRQILDKDGLMAGKVDDLELVFPEEGDGPPYVTAILSGPGALGRRVGGGLGSWLESVHVRLHPEEQPGPARVPFSIVKRVNNHVELSVSRETLESNRLERWVRDSFIGRIPGAHHAAE